MCNFFGNYNDYRSNSGKDIYTNGKWLAKRNNK